MSKILLYVLLALTLFGSYYFYRDFIKNGQHKYSHDYIVYALN